MKKLIGIAIVVALSLTAGLIHLVRASAPERVATRSPPPPVILITVDTLRADHLSCYGYERTTSPNIDRLAADAVVFDNAVTPSPSTGPSVASTMTSSYPHHHGVVHNFFQLHDQNTTLAEILKEHGYATAAFVSNYVLVRELSNLQQGFDVYDDYLSEKEANRDVYERSAAGTVNLAAAWLRDHRTGPFFLWVHLMDPHGPYKPPPPFDEKYRGMADPIARELIPNYQFLGSTDRSFYVDRYDGEIAYCDQQVGRLVDVLRSQDTYDESLIIFHADHGESLGENGSYFEHGVNVFEPCLRIPLVVKFPRSTAAGSSGPARSDKLVSVMDIAPTILDVIRIPTPPSYVGAPLQTILNQGRKTDEWVFAEAHMSDEKGGEQIAVRAPDRKLVVRLDSRRNAEVQWEGYFTVTAEPGVDQDLNESEDPERQALQVILRKHCEMLASHRFPFKRTHYQPDDGRAFMNRHNQEQMSESDRARYRALKALGYVE